ncbi:MAG: ADP-forming succinate--CoA ligase subunit beta [Phototrophicales bacterium]|nr:MAG: ADP-forming succinate--CoA ligase subunit beta [Phototrophicales bacterium]
MDLHEYQAKRRFHKFGIPVPLGKVAYTPDEAATIAQELGGLVVVKAQVFTGGRGKAGGVKLAKNPDEARTHAEAILGMDIKGHKVHKVLIDPGANIKKELYLSITNDRAARRPLLMCSAEGGMDIEEVNRTMPEKIVRIHIDPLLGLRGYQIVEVASQIDLPRHLWRQFNKICRALYECFTQSDATLCEINPLAIVEENGEEILKALDGKMSIDDNALFRQKELADERDTSAEPPEEIQAREADLSYVKLDGQIGCMVNGAGLAMATMDMTGHFGEAYGIGPANFLDIGGGAGPEKVAAALRIILADPNVKAILINIFGGITRCDDVARGLLTALDEVKTDLPLVIRLVGTNQEEGLKIIEEANLPNTQGARTLYEAAQKAVEIVREGMN